MLGLYVIRGDNMYDPKSDLMMLLSVCIYLKMHLCCRAVVGEVDDELDSQIDLSQISAAPLKPLAH